MLTPRFKLSQDENNIFITINAPYTNIKETEVDVDGENFLFVSSPYFLRLCLPGKIVENESAKGTYVCDSGDFNLVFEKVTPGEHFEHLDMITSLLAPREIPDVNPDLVQMLDDGGVTVEEDVDDDDTASVESEKYTYGFGNKFTDEFCEIGNEFPQIFELKTPELVPMNERHLLREGYENRKFSSDHYLADFYDHQLLAPYVGPIAKWDMPDFVLETEFTDEEVNVLKELPNKHYILSETENKQVLLGLVDILFGYCYDKRTTLNESTVESGWTINKLSSTLTWFCVFNDYKEVMIACYRRALVFPMFRNFELCNKVKQDVISLLRKGKTFVIKCLINIYKMFNTNNDARYILNQLYIKDYLVYIQKCRAEEIDELCHNIANVVLKKDDLDLELEEFENAAQLVECDEIVENEMALRMAGMSLLPDLKKGGRYLIIDSDSDSDSSDSSSDSDSSDLDSDDEDPF